MLHNQKHTTIYSPVLTVFLSDGFEVELTLVQESKKLSILDHQNHYGSLAGESSIKSDSQDLSQDISFADN